MSKMKIGVSTLLVLIVMSLFSMVAFATAPDATTSLRATIETNKNVKVFWSQVTGATSYKVYVDGTQIHQTTNGTTVTHTYTAADTAAKQWNIEVSAVNADGEGAKVSYKLASGPAYNADLGKATTDKQVDNDINNANQSGVGVGGQAINTGVLKSNGMVDNKGHKGAQRTHGEYQNNTNSCASCHQTHTAASKSLLFKDGVYSTCTACHDGTLGFYNVFGNDEQASTAGTFGGTHDGNMSVHMADGAVKMKAAPGGNPNGTGTWDKEFNCASCHSPHGSYSDRLLHYNPNGMGSTAPEAGGIKAENVTVYDFVPANWDVSKGELNVTAATTQFIGVRGTKAQLGLTDVKYNEIPETDKVIMIFEEPKNATATKYKKTTNPWIYGYPTRGSNGNNHYYYTRFFTADPATILNPGGANLPAKGTYPTAKQDLVIDHYDYLADTAHIKYGLGLVYAPASVLDAVTVAEVSRAYVVKLDMMPIVDPSRDSNGDKLADFGGVNITTVNQRALFAGDIFPANLTANPEKYAPYYNSTSKTYGGMGVAMSGYCASCHTDYLASTSNQAAGTEGEGTFDKAFRHTTTSDSYTCVRCHFAHGTDVNIMTDAHYRDVDKVAADFLANGEAADATAATTLAKEYMLDKGASSALKRFTNMAVCWSCHTSSRAEQLKNTDSYKYNDGDEHYDPRGIPAVEGKQNWPVLP